MIYNYINSKIIIAKVYDEFAIKSNDWESRSPQWIMDAISHLGIEYSLEEIAKDFEFNNYKVKIPCNTRMLSAVVYDGKPLQRTTADTFLLTNKIASQYVTPTYYIINNGNIELEVESGIITIIYSKPPFEWDDVLNMWFPMIPDNIQVIENILWYVLTRILARGYQHSVYNLTQNNGLTNPDMRWRNTIKSARNACNTMDATKRASMADILSRFLSNPHADIQELYNPRSKYGVRREPLYTFSDITDELNRLKLESNENS
jgi:hypothetical protein